jgi:PTS system N-acetylglucosamine-specific IIC component
MMPIAVLPAAALALGLGVYFQTVSWLSWGDTIWEIMTAGGDAVLGNLPLIFAVGVAIGFTGGAGAAGLAAAVGYVILKAINDVSIITEAPPDGEAVVVDMGVLGGILIGLIAAVLYDRYKDIRLPDYLAFFGGRRFVPIVTAFAAIILGAVAYFVWPPIGRAINDFGDWIVGAGALGAFAYGIANRALLPMGLHHILNALVWFQFGTYTTPEGEEVSGDLSRYLAGDPEAGLVLHHDVRSSGRRLCDVPRGGARPEEGDRGGHGLDRVHLVPHRYHRADRVQFPVPRSAAVRGTCGPVGNCAGRRERVRYQDGIRLLCRTHRLPR